MTDIKIRHKKFSEADFFTDHDDKGDNSLKPGAFKALGLEGFGVDLSHSTWGRTEKDFFNKFDVIGIGGSDKKGDDKLSRGEALLGLSILDGGEGFADVENIESIGKRMVSEYLQAAEKILKKDTDQYERALKFLFSAIKGFSNPKALELAETYRRYNASEIMPKLFFDYEDSDNVALEDPGLDIHDLDFALKGSVVVD